MAKHALRSAQIEPVLVDHARRLAGTPAVVAGTARVTGRTRAHTAAWVPPRPNGWRMQAICTELANRLNVAGNELLMSTDEYEQTATIEP